MFDSRVGSTNSLLMRKHCITAADSLWVIAIETLKIPMVIDAFSVGALAFFRLPLYDVAIDGSYV